MSALTTNRNCRLDSGSAGHAGGRWLLIVGALVTAIAAAAYIAVLVSYPRSATLRGFDLGIYRMGGFLARHDPAQLYVWQTSSRSPFTYTPFAALLFTPLWLASRAAWMDGAVVIGTSALAVTVWIAGRELGLPRNERVATVLLVSALAFWSEPVQSTLFLGQIELILMALVVWDMCQPETRRWKGVGTGIAAGIKLVPLIFIAYLLITRRLRAAAVAAGAFLATIVVGFVASPAPSVTWWLHGYFLRSGRAGFVGGDDNQSLLGILTRFAGSPDAAKPLWIAAAAVVGAVGLGAAAMLHRAGRTFEGLCACALTALLVSPISWGSHWVWVAPGLVVFVAAAIRATHLRPRLAWAGGAALVAATFVDWPRSWLKGRGLLHGGLLSYARPRFATYTLTPQSPLHPEYHWHALQLVFGNAYFFAACGLFVFVLCRVVPELRDLGQRLALSRRRWGPGRLRLGGHFE